MPKPNKTARSSSSRNEYDGDDLELDSDGDSPFSVFITDRTSRKLEYYLSSEFVTPNKYVDMFHEIRHATEDDEVVIYLNSGGGETDTGVQLLNVIRATAAPVTMVLDSKALSMAGLLFLSGDHQKVGDNALLMFHNYSSGLDGKGNEQLAEVAMSAKWFAKLMQDTCSPFLSKAEITGVLNGKDIWMESDEIRARLENMRKQEKKAKAAKAKAAAKPKAPAPAESDAQES